MAEIKHLPEQETGKRHQDGMDWGAPSRILARSEDGDTRLIMVAGHQAANGSWGHGRSYQPAALWLVSRRGWSGIRGRQTRMLCTGRLDAGALDREHGQLIDRAFGCQGLARAIDPRRTVVVCDRGTAAPASAQAASASSAAGDGKGSCAASAG